MKKVVILLLSGFLVISLMGNVILLMKLNEKNKNDELEYTVEASNVPSEVIGNWTAKAGRKVEIFKDGKVYWTYNTDKGIYNGYIGKLDGYSIILSQHYDGGMSGEKYQSMEEVPKIELKNTSVIYDITMHGENAFSAQNVDPNEYPWSFVKEENKAGLGY